MKLKWSESPGFPPSCVCENVFITRGSWEILPPSPGVYPEGIGALRGDKYVYGAARRWELRDRKVLKIYKSVHIEPKRSTTKGLCGWVGIFDKV